MTDTTPTTLREMIALPASTMAIIQSAINSPAGGSLLFHGPGGTGKSIFCRVIAMEAMRSSSLIVPDYRTALGFSNLMVLDHVSGYEKPPLNKVREMALMHTLSDTDRRWLIVDEFDAISPKISNFVKPWLDELQIELSVQVFASTNHLTEIDGNVRSRFTEIYLGPHPDPAMRDWARAELKRLGLTKVSAADLAQLVANAAGSVRALKRACFLYAEHGRVI
ncbi:MAG TPA: AAA family ATPase [Devosia sp.]|nr:AAA family ATPase [Devosia sp.]